jgi:hypothetical protein
MYNGGGLYQSGARFSFAGVDVYGAAARRGLGDALDDYAGGDTLANAYAGDPALSQLHQLALVIVQLRDEANAQLNYAADADSTDFDPNVLSAILAQIQTEVAAFGTMRATINANTLKMYDLSPLDNAMLAIGGWAQSFANIVSTVVTTVGNLPTTTANYLSQQLQNIAAAAAAAAKAAAEGALKAIEPLLIAGGVVLVGLVIFAREAEKTRTGRALVKHI